MQYPDGALKATFDNSSIINQTVPAVYGAAIVDPYTGGSLKYSYLDKNTAAHFRCDPLDTVISSVFYLPRLCVMGSNLLISLLGCHSSKAIWRCSPVPALSSFFC